MDFTDAAAEEDLLLDKMASGDRPSLYAAGFAAAQSLKKTGIAVFMTDVLGRVYILPPDVIEVKRRPRLQNEELDSLQEDEAIQLLVRQGDDENSILQYLKRRSTREE